MEDTSSAMPVTPKQIAYARSLALKNQTLLPWEVQQDRRALSSWIDAHAKLKPVSALDQLPSSKQVAFAERLARVRCQATSLTETITSHAQYQAPRSSVLKRFPPARV